MWAPTISLFQWLLFVDLTTLRAQIQRTRAKPRKGMTRSRQSPGSRCPRGEEYEGSLVRLRGEADVTGK